MAFSIRLGCGSLVGLAFGLYLGLNLLWAFAAPASRVLFVAPLVSSVLLGGFLGVNWGKPFWRGVAEFIFGACPPVVFVFEYVSPGVSTPVAIGTGIAAVVCGVMAVCFSDFFWGRTGRVIDFLAGRF